MADRVDVASSRELVGDARVGATAHETNDGPSAF
jgi:hypothetical protein